jgi:hypothetical protein
MIFTHNNIDALHHAELDVPSKCKITWTIHYMSQEYGQHSLCTLWCLFTILPTINERPYKHTGALQYLRLCVSSVNPLFFLTAIQTFFTVNIMYLQTTMFGEWLITKTIWIWTLSSMYTSTTPQSILLSAWYIIHITGKRIVQIRVFMREYCYGKSSTSRYRRNYMFRTPLNTKRWFSKCFSVCIYGRTCISLIHSLTDFIHVQYLGVCQS